MKSWEPQPWWLLVVLIPFIALVSYGAYYIASLPSPPQVIIVHIDGPIHVIIDKAPQ